MKDSKNDFKTRIDQKGNAKKSQNKLILRIKKSSKASCKIIEKHERRHHSLHPFGIRSL